MHQFEGVLEGGIKKKRQCVWYTNTVLPHHITFYDNDLEERAHIIFLVLVYLRTWKTLT